MPNTNYPRRAKRISELLAKGLTLNQACARPDMPRLETVRDWLMNSPDFRRRYVRARRIRNESLIEQVLELADGLPLTATDVEVRQQKTRIDARKWAVGQFRDPVFVEADDADDLPQIIVKA